MIPAVSGVRPPPLHPFARVRLERRRRARERDRTDLLLRPAGRRPGADPEDLLHPRPDCADLVRVLRLGRLEGPDASAHARPRRRPRELRGDPPGRHLRRADAGHRLDLGASLVGDLVDLELEPARHVPGPVSLLLGLLHAALLGRAGAGAGEHVRGLRALRGRADPGLLALDPVGQRLHPPDCLHPPRAADVRLDVLHLLRFVGGLLLLAATMYRVELAGKRLDARLRELRELLA